MKSVAAMLLMSLFIIDFLVYHLSFIISQGEFRQHFFESTAETQCGQNNINGLVVKEKVHKGMHSSECSVFAITIDDKSTPFVRFLNDLY